MLYPVVVPKAPTDAIPRGAAILKHGRGSALVFGGTSRERFGERCAQAVRRGQLIRLPGRYRPPDALLAFLAGL